MIKLIQASQAQDDCLESCSTPSGSNISDIQTNNKNIENVIPLSLLAVGLEKLVKGKQDKEVSLIFLYYLLLL